MRVVRDAEYIKKRKRQATLTAIAGVATLVVAFMLATTGRGETMVLLAYVPLLAGTVLFHLGMQQVAKWNRKPRNDEILDKLLHNLSERYTLVHYADLGGRVVEHLLVHPGGVLSLTVRDLMGTIRYKNGHWLKAGGGISRLFSLGGPPLGNPDKDAAADVRAIESDLKANQLEADSDAAIVFVNPRAVLEIEEPEYPVTNAEGLSELVRHLPSDASMSNEERQALVALLSKGQAVERQEPVRRKRPVKRRAA